MEQTLIKWALACGATRAAALPACAPVLNAAFRDICQSNACGNYGQCYMCPPDAGDIHALMAQVRACAGFVLYQTLHPLEDAFDYDGMVAAGERHVAVSRALEDQLREQMPGRYLHLSAGGCKVCPVCAKRDGLPCRAPALAMPSLESYGVDVCQTALLAGLPYRAGENAVLYFGMVCLKEGAYADADPAPRG